MGGGDKRQKWATIWLLVGTFTGIAVLVTAAVLALQTDDSVASSSQSPVTTATEAPVDTTTDSTEPPESTTTSTVVESTTTTVAETTTTSTTSTTMPVDEMTEAERAATTAADDWIQAIASGDEDAAWELLAPESQLSIGGRDGFTDIFTGLQEGFGAWANAEFVITWADTVDLEAVVVTYVGTVTQEGTTGPAAAAVPVVVDDGLNAAVQPFTRGETVAWIIPDLTFTPAVLDSPSPLFKVVVPANSVDMFINGEPAIALTVTDLGDGTFEVSGLSQFSLEVGSQNVITVVYTAEGILHADAATFFILEDSQ